MRRIFINYRRTDAEYAAGALGRALRKRFGEEQVFRDKEDIAGGESWKQKVLSEIDRDSALLVLIGASWSSARDAEGRRRLDNADDPIRLEIADGLRDRAAVIPVLLENARMPSAAELPSELAPMAEYNALPLRDSDWERDVENICRTLEKSGFRSLGPAAEHGASEATSPVMRGPSLKLVFAYVCGGLALFGLAGQSDRDTHIGGAFFAVVAFGLAVWAYREFRSRRAGRAWPVVTAVVLGLVTALGHVGYAVEASPDSGGRSVPELNNGHAERSDDAIADVGGVWLEQDGTPLTVTQQGRVVHVAINIGGVVAEGDGVLDGRRLQAQLACFGQPFGSLEFTVDRRGRAMRCAVTSAMGVANGLFHRQ